MEDVRSAAISVDGLSMLTASEDSTAKLWIIESGTCIQVMGEYCKTGGILPKSHSWLLNRAAQEQAVAQYRAQKQAQIAQIAHLRQVAAQNAAAQQVAAFEL